MITTFFKINFIKKILRVSNGLDPDQAQHFVGLIWVQTVCKGYQQMTLVAKELKSDSLHMVKAFR